MLLLYFLMSRLHRSSEKKRIQSYRGSFTILSVLFLRLSSWYHVHARVGINDVWLHPTGFFKNELFLPQDQKKEKRKEKKVLGGFSKIKRRREESWWVDNREEKERRKLLFSFCCFRSWYSSVRTVLSISFFCFQILYLLAYLWLCFQAAVKNWGLI